MIFSLSSSWKTLMLGLHKHQGPVCGFWWSRICNAAQLNAIDLRLSLLGAVRLLCSNIAILIWAKTCSLSNQFCSKTALSMWVRVWIRVSTHSCVCAYMPVFQHRHIFPQVTNHGVKDEVTAADRLMRSTCAGNRSCHWKYVIYAQKRGDANGTEKSAGVCSAMRGEIHWFCNCTTIDHKCSTSMWCRLSLHVTVTPWWCWAECLTEWWCGVYPCMGYLSPSAVWCWIKEALRQTVCQMW